MKHTLIILTLFSGLISSSLIKGKILDIDSKSPVLGANVYIEESGVGAATDKFGIFYIQSDSKKLKVSHIGYLDIEYLIEDFKDIIIFLEPSVINSEELIVTGTRTPKAFKDSPVLTRVVSNQEIKDSQSRNLYDIMNEIFPGYQRLKGEHSMSNEIRFNGLGTKSILFMVDGQKINAEYGGNMDLSVIDINNIEKIEYVDGTISTLYGSGAMGGAVNIITKEINKKSYNLNVNLFSNTPSINSGHISYFQDWGVVDGGVSVTSNQSDGFDLKQIEYINDNDPIQKHQEEFSNLNANIKINFDFDRVNLGISHNIFLSSINTYKMADLDNNPFTLSIVPEFELPRNYNFRTSFKLKFQRDESTLINYNFSTEDYEKRYKYTGFGEQLWSASYTNNHLLIVNKDFSKGSVLFGLDMTSDKYVSYDVESGNGDEPDEYSIFDEGNSRDVEQHSLFVNSDWVINSINISSGLRYQYHEAYDAHLIPMLSLYKKYDKYKLRGTWSKGYRAPNLKELYYEWHTHPGGGSILGNENLQPEKSEYLSLSLESFKDFYYSINIYHNSLENMINWIPEAPNNYRYTNFEKVSLNGVNIFYKRKLSGNGELTFSYNYLDAYDHILDARLNGSNFHNLNTKLTYFILDNLKTRVSFKYSSPKKYTECVQNCGGEASDYIFKLSDFSLVDISIRYDFSDSMSGTIGVNNIFNYKDPNAASEQFLTLMNPGRTAIFSIDYNLRQANED